MNAQQIQERLENQDVILLVYTNSPNGYADYYRFLSDGRTVPCKSLRSLERKGIFNYSDIIEIPKSVAIMNHYSEYYHVKENIKTFLN